MRRLVLLGALFMLGAVFSSKTAVAVPLCDCDICPSHPNTLCQDWQNDWYLCDDYSSLYCSQSQQGQAGVVPARRNDR